MVVRQAAAHEDRSALAARTGVLHGAFQPVHRRPAWSGSMNAQQRAVLGTGLLQGEHAGHDANFRRAAASALVDRHMGEGRHRKTGHPAQPPRGRDPAAPVPGAVQQVRAADGRGECVAMSGWPMAV